jgi:T-complex protein 1 subunit theta
MNKMVINKLGKLFVTNDAATILKELEVIHPAAKMIVMASNQQQSEQGDGTNLVVVLAGELLAQAEVLLKMGLHPSDVIRGYEKALEEVQAILKRCVVKTVENLKDESEVEQCLRSAISAKQNGYEDTFAPLVARACIDVLPADASRFNVDNVRVAKVLGGGITDAQVVRGLVLTKDTEGTIKQLQNAKVAVYSQGLEIEKTDTKGKVFIEKATELENYAKTEEDALEAKIKAIKQAGINLVISGGNTGEMPMHYLEKYQIMVIRSSSKFELRRICQTLNAQPLMAMNPPTPEETGHLDSVSVEEIGGTRVTVLRQDKSKSGISTILVRAATNNILDDIERAIEDATNIFKSMTKNASFVAGAGAAEIELSRHIKSFGDRTAGQDQYAIKKFAEAFEVVPRILADNAGLDATSVISNLYAQHEQGNTHVGVDIEGSTPAGVKDATQKKIYDSLSVKQRAIELATTSVVTILRISQIIMSKPSGVPVPGAKGSGTMGAMDNDDDL